MPSRPKFNRSRRASFRIRYKFARHTPLGGTSTPDAPPGEFPAEQGTLAERYDGVTSEESNMNSDEIKGKWKQLTGDIKSRWGKLTDDDLKEVDGEKDKLVGKLQERYGKSREEAEKELENW